MDGYVLNEPAVINGIKHTAGEIIQGDELATSRIPTLLRTGVISKIGIEDSKSIGKINIPILSSNGNVSVGLDTAVVIRIFSMLQQSSEDVIKQINLMTSDDELVVINACDSRKAVQKAAKERAIELANESGED